MPRKTIKIETPLVIMFEQPDGDISCVIYPSEKVSSHRHYGLLVCDLVRHVARAFAVDEQDVWEWVDKERDRPTTDITQPS